MADNLIQKVEKQMDELEVRLQRDRDTLDKHERIIRVAEEKKQRFEHDLERAEREFETRKKLLEKDIGNLTQELTRLNAERESTENHIREAEHSQQKMRSNIERQQELAKKRGT